MKKPVIIACTLLCFNAFGAKVTFMEEASAPAQVEKDPEKAVLVVHSNTNFHLIKAVYDYFLDDQLIGQDKKNTWFTTKVDPGTHYIFFTIKEKIYNTGRIDFEAGKVYYVLRKAVPGGNIMTTQTPEDFAQYLEENETAFCEFKPGDKMAELDKDDVDEAVEEFLEEVKEEPEKHKDVLEYKGF